MSLFKHRLWHSWSHERFCRMRLRKGHVRSRVRHAVQWYTYGDYTTSKSAMSSPTVVVACGLGCGTDSSGLRCRVNRTTTVDAEYDPERKAVCCAVPRVSARCATCSSLGSKL
jgi:hypothetical protein